MKTTLIIMAAGMGSRFGGPKQIAPVDESGRIIMDYSVYDAVRAGFDSVVCVIKPEMQQDFAQAVGQRLADMVELHYAYQRLDDLPAGFAVPAGRTKPWGTAHAVHSAKEWIDGPFAVINADDFYGASSFASIQRFLAQDARPGHHAMVGYPVENTLTENGSVARGICQVDEQNNLRELVERLQIEVRPGGAAYTEDGEHFHFLPAGTLVSMNMWGFGQDMMEVIEQGFAEFLEQNLAQNPLKCEYYLPVVVGDLLQKQAAQVRVLPTTERWHGVTYAQDMPQLQEALRQLRQEGAYPW